jgi:hypothetical protein
MVSPPTPEERPHVDAMRRAYDAGFRAAQMAGAVIHAWRQHDGVIDTYTAIGWEEASAARYRDEDYPHGDVLWQRTGTIADVITELLALPRDGERGAPRLTHRPESGLWVVGG